VSVVLCRFWTVAREQNESKKDYFNYPKEHNNIIIIFVAAKCGTLHNRPHVKPLNTYRLLLYVEADFILSQVLCSKLLSNEELGTLQDAAKTS